MRTVRVGVSPYIHLRPECFHGYKDCDPGVELNILDTIMSMAHLNIQLVISNETGCGKYPADANPNGTWTGLYKMLKDGQIDVTGNLCNLNNLYKLRDVVFPVSWPVWQYNEQFLIQALSPPPLTFAPFVPFSRWVWMAYALTWLAYVLFLAIDAWVRQDSAPFMKRFQLAFADLNDTCCLVKKVPLRLIWPLWFVMLGTVFIFYKTFILAAILHPWPVRRPFGDTGQLAEQLYDGKYKLLSYKDKPSIPGGCDGRPCGVKINEALKIHKFQYMPGAAGRELSTAIVDQDISDDRTPRLVLVNGMPFITMYLSEYKGDRNMLWLIEGEGSFWSGYLWRKDFPYADRMNKNLIEMGDSKWNQLDKYAKIDPKPRTEEFIQSDMADREAISLARMRNLFYVYLGALAASIVVFLMELLFARLQPRISNSVFMGVRAIKH